MPRASTPVCREVLPLLGAHARAHHMPRAGSLSMLPQPVRDPQSAVYRIILRDSRASPRCERFLWPRESPLSQAYHKPAGVLRAGGLAVAVGG